jgi:hypothetical protein
MVSVQGSDVGSVSGPVPAPVAVAVGFCFLDGLGFRECQAIIELEDIQNEELVQWMDDLGAILYTLTLDKNLRKPDRNRNQ